MELNTEKCLERDNQPPTHSERALKVDERRAAFGFWLFLLLFSRRRTTTRAERGGRTYESRRNAETASP
jgi:hypothetical protein